MIQPPRKSADDHDIARALGERKLNGKLGIGQVLFGRDLVNFHPVRYLFFLDGIKIAHEDRGLLAKQSGIIKAAVGCDQKVVALGVVGDMGRIDRTARVYVCSHDFLLHSCLFFSASNIETKL